MRNISKYIIILVIMILALPVFGQKKRSLTISGVAAKFINKEDQVYDWDRHEGYFHYANPGIELIYMQEISERFELGAGVSYQHGAVSSYIKNGEHTFTFDDICISLLFKKYIKIKEYDHLYTTTGFYNGKTTKIKAAWPASSGWIQLPTNKVAYYSDDVVFSDFYLDFGYHTSLKKTFIFSVAPFLKYRINNTWMNYHQNKFHYGFKLNFSLNF